jgi:single-strand DNA-binding protein
MPNMNKVFLIGHLGQDPEVKTLPNGTVLCKFTLATSEKFKSKDGQQQEKTQWHRVNAWGKTGELAGQYLKKGSAVLIEGKIEYGSYEKDGVKHYTTDINAMNVTFLSNKGGKGEGGGVPEVASEDLPF